jgi:hypothetical protein
VGRVPQTGTQGEEGEGGGGGGGKEEWREEGVDGMDTREAEEKEERSEIGKAKSVQNLLQPKIRPLLVSHPTVTNHQMSDLFAIYTS